MAAQNFINSIFFRAYFLFLFLLLLLLLVRAIVTVRWSQPWAQFCQLTRITFDSDREEKTEEVSPPYHSSPTTMAGKEAFALLRTGLRFNPKFAGEIHELEVCIVAAGRRVQRPMQLRLSLGSLPFLIFAFPRSPAPPLHRRL